MKKSPAPLAAWSALALVALIGSSPALAAPTTVKADLKKSFSHESHLAIDTLAKDRKLTCNDCHAIEAKAEGENPICEDTRMPFPTHETCTGCHAKAFFTKPLRICTNCHMEASFTKKSDMKPQTETAAPLRTVFNHKLHLDPKMRVRKNFKFEKDCTFCHAFVGGGRKVELPAHAQCCECHTKERVEPNINDCATCHARPKKEKNPVSSIRKFSHKDHKSDPKTGGTLACNRCHSTVAKTKKIARLQMPQMATCIECHNGETSFDYSECLKCHGTGIEKKPLPKDHPPPKKKAAKPEKAAKPNKAPEKKDDLKSPPEADALKD